jgi:hypothetical protein
MNVRNWNKVAQNRDSWKNVVEQDRTLYRLQRFKRRRRRNCEVVALTTPHLELSLMEEKSYRSAAFLSLYGWL